MDSVSETVVSRILTFSAALLVGSLLMISIGSLVLGALGFSLPHLCAGW